MRLLWLPEVLRAAGLTVVEIPGWRTRGSESWGPIKGLIYHATADKARTGQGDLDDDAGAIAVIRDGRPGLPGPIASAYIDRQGGWHIIASGRCNTVKTGWGGELSGLGNSSIAGFEAENDNKGEPWPAAQLDSLRRGFAAILRRLDLPVRMLVGHKEHQPGDKSDPFGINMADFRASVARVLAGRDDEMADSDEILRVTKLIADRTHGWQVANEQRFAALSASLGEVLGAMQQLADRPDPGTVVVSDEQLERVLRKVIGSVDGASPAA
nr:N-acetylmuramoyl-L-alanine amidase [Micromonospora sp. DSM 115978]